MATIDDSILELQCLTVLRADPMDMIDLQFDNIFKPVTLYQQICDCMRNGPWDENMPGTFYSTFILVGNEEEEDHNVFHDDGSSATHVEITTERHGFLVRINVTVVQAHTTRNRLISSVSFDVDQFSPFLTWYESSFTFF